MARRATLSSAATDGVLGAALVFRALAYGTRSWSSVSKFVTDKGAESATTACASGKARCRMPSLNSRPKRNDFCSGDVLHSVSATTVRSTSNGTNSSVSALEPELEDELEDDADVVGALSSA